jgi:tetratricopeptide (TPR) repeat protein
LNDSEPDTIPLTQASDPGASRSGPAGSKLLCVELERYQLEKEIARGGMGRILAARDLRHQRPVAIKELISGDDRRFEREALITAALQHPAIVPVYEAGRWPNGSPFYAMKLVEGEPLDRAIARQASLAQRIALLPNVIAVADALAYAHQRRIIHRDLKPANVLLGPFGETYVIDWGLAKRLDVADDDAPTLRPSATRLAGGELTVEGDIVGTPLYMPPEQASGESVDQRADVYALGAMLYHTLAGAPPYEHARAEVMLARVIEAPPIALTARVEGVPADLVAIVNKAMARVPTDRYADAAQLAADLRRFQAGQLVLAHEYSTMARVARFVRKNLIAVAIAALLGAAGIVLAVQRERVVVEHHRAELELARADAARDHANALVETLHDLTPKLLRLGRLDVLDNLALSLIEHYQARELTDPVEHRGYGIALLVHGYVQLLHRSRNGIDAAGTLQHARAELLLYPSDQVAQTSLLDVWTELAQADLTPDERISDANHGIAIAEELARGDARDAHVKRAWAKALCARAGVYTDEGRFAEARVDIDRATKLGAQLPASGDDDELAEDGEVEVELHNAVAWLENQQGHVREAREAYDQVRASAAATLVRVADASILNRQAEAAQWSCLLSIDLGEKAIARTACDEALRVATALVAIDRTNVESLGELADAHLATAKLDGDDARQQLDAALQVAKQRDPLYEADVHRDVAKWATEHHDWVLARDEADTAVALLRSLAVSLPKDTPIARRVGWNLDTAGSARVALGDLDGAAPQLDEGLAVCTRLLAADPQARPLQTDMADAKMSLAQLALARHEVSRARTLLGEAIEIRERIAHEDPDDGDNRVGLDKLRQLLPP